MKTKKNCKIKCKQIADTKIYTLFLLSVEESEVAIKVSNKPRSISLVVKLLKLSSVKGNVPSNKEDLCFLDFFSRLCSLSSNFF